MAAQLFLLGYLPYKDFFYPYPPLGLEVLSLFFAIAGVGIDKARYVVFLSILLCGAFLYFFTKKAFNEAIAKLALLIFVADGLIFYFSRSFVLEPICIAMIMLSLLSFLKGNVVVAGGLIGLACGVKQSSVIILLVFISTLVLYKRWRDLALFSISSAASFLLILLPFLIIDPSNLQRQLFANVIIESQRHDLLGHLKTLAYQMMKFSGFTFVAGISGCFLMISSCFAKKKNKKLEDIGFWELFIISWILLSILIFSLAKFVCVWDHTLILLEPPLCICGGVFIYSLVGRRNVLDSRKKALLLLLLVLFVFMLFIDFYQCFMVQNQLPAEVGSYIEKNTTPNDEVLSVTSIFTFFAHRKPACLIVSGITSIPDKPALRECIIQRLEEGRIRYIVLMPGNEKLLGSEVINWMKENTTVEKKWENRYMQVTLYRNKLCDTVKQ